MSSSYEEKTPSRLWYIWQHAKAYVHCLREDRVKKDARKIAQQGAFATGSLAAAALANHYLLYIPLVPTIASIAGLAAGGYFGYQAWQKARYLKGTSAFYNYVRKQEHAWIDAKSKPALSARLSAFGKRLFGKSMLPVVKTGQWLGFGTAGAAAAFSGVAALNFLGLAQIDLGFAISALAAVAKAGAAIGLSTTAALYGTAALIVAAVPLGIAAGISCRNRALRLKAGFVDHRAPARSPTLKSRLASPAAVQGQKPANGNKPASAFQEKAQPPAADTPERAAAAAARAEMRRRNKGGAAPRF